MNVATPVETLVTDHLDLWTAALKRKSTAGRGSSSKVELYGIKKLRELILELAVRGLLVPQDPNDESASELLKKIAAEKAKLVKAGKINKEKPLSLIAEEENPFDLPKGWVWARLGSFGETNIGLTYKPSNAGDSGIPVLRSSNIQRGRIDLSDLVRVSNVGIKESAMVEVGDLLICARNGSKALVGKTAQIKALSEPMYFGAFMAIFRSRLNNYIEVFLNSPLFRKNLEGVDTTTINQLTQANLIGTLATIPPLAEQRRIVAKVDELMALCDQLEQETDASLGAHQTLVETLLSALTSAGDHAQFANAWQRIAGHFDTLFTTEESIAQLKQTILQLAVMGKLVPQDPNDELASELLKKIAAEKAKLVKEGRIKKEKPLPLVTEVESVYELPAGWEWVRLGDVTSGMDSGWSPACLEHMSPSDDVWGVLKTTAVQVMQYWEHENKELPSKLNPRPEAEAKVGDILFTRAGPKNRVGISCFVDRTRPRLMISDKIIRFHPIEIGVYGRFLALSMNSGGTAEYLEKAKSGMAASQVNISQEKLRCAPVPLLPLAEQHRIVAKVDELMALCDQLKSRLNDAQTTQLHLADALVEQAIC